MSRKKLKVHRFALSITEAQNTALRAMMADDLQEDVSNYFGMMIAEITRRRADEKRPGRGRPRTVAMDAHMEPNPDSEEERNIPHPDIFMHKGVMMTQSEADAWNEMKGLTQPK